MAEERRVINGFEFASKEEYEKAKKEVESIRYIKAHTDMTNMQQVLKVYNKASEMEMFHTVIGYEFMHQLYYILVKNKVVEAEYMRSIPIKETINKKSLPEDVEASNRLAEQFRVLYEDAKEKRKRIGIVAGFLGVLIVIMFGLVYFNYSTYDENAVLDKYSSWEDELEQREEALREKEKQWEEQHPQE